MVWIKCEHTITYFSSHPHSKLYNAYARSMPAVGGQGLNDWTRTAETAEAELFLCFAFEQFFICCSPLKSLTYHLVELQPEALCSSHQIPHTLSTNYCSSASTEMTTFGEKRYLVLRHIQSLFIETVNKGQLQSVLTMPLVLLIPITGKWSESKVVDRIQAAV